ncbi:hemolysin [Porphyromonas macacae]|uniref:Hemolysin n=1 Tax=Porphyromonas macacae TaxID=28115 RepID=A0A0A2EAE1_9PORP|nr:gliding motility-associated protein GldE [Porphyromonas macacae]KGN74425.1 hemolysin [Porphyromonas macacae]
MFLLNILDQVSVYPLSSAVIIAIAVTVILLFMSGYMSSSEVAFFSLTPQNLEEIKEEKTPADRSLLKVLSDSERLLATILIGNNLINVAIIMLTAYTFRNLFDFRSSVVGFIIQTVLLTALLLLFGEIIPKVYAQKHSLKMSRFSASKMEIIIKLLKPVSSLLIRSSSVVTDSFGNRKYNLSAEDLSQAVNLIDGESQVGEKKLLTEIVKFSNKTASDIMVPRMDMVDVDISWDFDKILEEVISSGYSRIPVYENTEDNIKGILYVKDLIPYKDAEADFNWQKLIRKAYFVPENKRLDNLLEEFRANRMHMSIVVDEYGGTSGIITLEDILEEILGEISDEYDQEEPLYKQLSDGSYLFQAKTSINDVRRALHIEPGSFGEYEEEVDTLGGLLMEIKQDLVHTGDSVTTEGWTITATKMERYRITEVKLTPPPSSADGGENR